MINANCLIQVSNTSSSIHSIQLYVLRHLSLLLVDLHLNTKKKEKKKKENGEYYE